jgi:hypothetical protein
VVGVGVRDEVGIKLAVGGSVAVGSSVRISGWFAQAATRRAKIAMRSHRCNVFQPFILVNTPTLSDRLTRTCQIDIGRILSKISDI